MVHTLLLLTAALLLPAVSPAQEPAEGWDFVPGERLLFYDDFTDMVKGGAPPHWKVRGASLKLDTNGRLVATQESKLWPNVTAWPKNFTLEMDFTVEKGTGDPQREVTWNFGDADEGWTWWFRFNLQEDGSCALNLEVEGGANEVACKHTVGKPNTLALWVQDNRYRIYLNGERLMDMNQVKVEPWQVAWLVLNPSDSSISMSRFRIAESSPDVSQSIMASGRWVTHGIQFDVNSDRLRPESAPVLKLVAEALAKQPALKLRIEGHTDSIGDAAKNLDLSKRRAESVKNALVGQFSVSGDRLTTAGMGQTKPVSNNDTPEGRANNRRVEFAKL